MPLPDFATLQPVEPKPVLPDFDSLKPVTGTPRFDTSQVKLDPQQAAQMAGRGIDPEHIDPSMTMADIVSGRGGSTESAANVYRAAGTALRHPLQTGRAVLSGAGLSGAVLSGAGDVARSAGADLVATLFNDPEYGGNLKAMSKDDSLPVDKFLGEVSR